MAKDKPVSDSADYLARRQGQVLRTLLMGVQGGGLDAETWMRLYAEEVPLATRGHVSERTQRALHVFNDHGFYRKPVRLNQLVKRLMEDFGAAQRIYTNKGLLTLAPADELRFESTLSGEAPMMDEVPDFLSPVGEEEEKGEHTENGS